MNTRLTLADARAALYQEVDAYNPNNPMFVQRLNEARERFYYSGKWKGTVVEATYPTPQGYLSLDRDHQALLALRYRCASWPIFTQFLPYMENGPGHFDDTKRFPGVLVDMGDGFATQADIVDPGTLRATIANSSDAAKVVRIFGQDENGVEVYDSSGNQGINLTLANPTANTSIQFSRVTGIQAPANMLGYWTLSVVNGSVATQLSVYAPGETRSMYRRYHTGVMTQAVHVIVSRRFFNVSAETDWVIPGNLSALRCGLQGLAQEASGDNERAEMCFSRGLNYLNQEAKISRGGAIPPVNFITEFSRGVNIGA